MEQVAGSGEVILSEVVDGGGAVGGKGGNGLFVIVQQGGIEVEEVVVDALRHLTMLLVKIQRVALEQAGAVLGEAVLHTVYGHPVGNIGHPEGFGNLLVGQCPPLVQHREQGA